MRALHLLRTSWAPHSLAFSPDGTRLAAGGGGWNGGGGVVLARVPAGEARLSTTLELFGEAGRPGRSPTVAGVSFSADGRVLAVATRAASCKYAPTYLLAVSDLALARVATLVHPRPDFWTFATGVLLHEASTITRHASAPPDIVAVWPNPPGLECRGDDRPHLTHSRVVVARGRAITGGDLLEADADPRAPTGGLLCAPLDGVGPVEVVPARPETVTAIAACVGGGFLTGGRHGELDRWTWSDGWRPTALTAEPDASSPARREDATRFASKVYTPDSVVAVCTLRDEERWVSVDAGGRLRLWEGDELVGGWWLPEAGSPRCAAAHPSEPWLAVGLKHGAHGRSSVVLLLDLGEALARLRSPACARLA